MSDTTNLIEMARDIEERDEFITRLRLRLEDSQRQHGETKDKHRRCLDELRRRPPRVCDDWNLGDPPQCKCGVAMVAEVHDTGDGWAWGWWCPGCGADGLEIAWPFIEDIAWPSDWEHIGIEVV